MEVRVKVFSSFFCILILLFQLAFESLALLSTALRHLEVGQLGVCKFGDVPELLHTLDSQFMESSGAHVMSQLKFEQKKTNIAAVSTILVF